MTTPEVLIIDRPLPGVQRLTLNRPEKRNALNNALRGAIFSALQAPTRDPEIKVRSSAAPALLSARATISPQTTRVDQPYSYRRRHGQWARHVVEGWFRIWDLAKPVIAQVHGYCLAGGSELATGCDLVYVAEDAQIGYPPTRLMSPPDMQFHPWLMGMRTRHGDVSHRRCDHRDRGVRQDGFANRAFPADELDEEVLDDRRAHRAWCRPTASRSTSERCTAPWRSWACVMRCDQVRSSRHSPSHGEQPGLSQAVQARRRQRARAAEPARRPVPGLSRTNERRVG